MLETELLPCAAALCDRSPHRFASVDLGNPLERRAHITLHRKSTRRVLAELDMVDRAHAIAACRDAERCGQIVAALIRLAAVSRVQCQDGIVGLLVERMPRMRHVLQIGRNGRLDGRERGVNVGVNRMVEMRLSGRLRALVGIGHGPGIRSESDAVLRHDPRIQVQL